LWAEELKVAFKRCYFHGLLRDITLTKYLWGIAITHLD